MGNLKLVSVKLNGNGSAGSLVLNCFDIEKKTAKVLFSHRNILKNFGIIIPPLDKGEVITSVDGISWGIVTRTEVAGSKFVYTEDSSRTKGEVLGDECPEGQENEPMFRKGEESTRKVDLEVIELAMPFSELKELIA